MANVKFNKNITICGSKLNIDKAWMVLSKTDVSGSEFYARLKIQKAIDSVELKASILYNGNSVWSKKKVLASIKRVKNNGMKSMTDYLYKFLSLSCGSIAHYNKHGWIEVYPTISHLRQFFCCNECGERVLSYIPDWKIDCKHIVVEIEKVLEI